MLIPEHGENCSASLTTCSGDELTVRVPCEVRFGRIRGVDFTAPQHVIRNGVAERMVAWCADCGKIVTSHRLGRLFVLQENGPFSAFDGGIIMFYEHFTPAARA